MESIEKAIFVNKPLDFGKIKQIGFSIDNTLVQYTEQFYQIVFDLLIDDLVATYKYPASVKELKYAHNQYAAAGAVDQKTGCVLQVDEFGNIHACKQGAVTLTKAQFTRLYPQRSVRLDNGGFYVVRSSFCQILISAFSGLVEQFIQNYQNLRDPLAGANGAREPWLDTEAVEGRLEFQSLFQDVYEVYNKLLANRQRLLELVKKSPDLFIKSPRHMRETLERLHRQKQTFILTNLDPEYAFFVLQIVLGESFRKYFSFIIFCKNLNGFFHARKPFRLYYEEKRTVGLGFIGQQLQTGKVYQNGNIFDFEDLSGVKAKHTLFCNDYFLNQHEVYKLGLWHFCQICPTLELELETLRKNKDILHEISKLKGQQRCLQSIYSSENHNPPADLASVNTILNEQTRELQEKFGEFGSSFFTCWSLTDMGQKIRNACDIYCASAACFYYYAPFYVFSLQSQTRFLPHQLVEMQLDEIAIDEGCEGVASDPADEL